MHEDASREREDLCLVLHAAERGGEYEPVIIALELRAFIVALNMPCLLSEALRRNKLLPVHHDAKVVK